MGSRVDVEEKAGNISPTSVVSDHSEHPTRIFRVFSALINLSVAAATVGTFASLLSFNPSNAAASCGELLPLLPSQSDSLTPSRWFRKL